MVTETINLDSSSRTVQWNGVIERLTPTEYDLLNTLIQHYPRPVTYLTLCRSVWGSDVELRPNLKWYIWKLREILGRSTIINERRLSARYGTYRLNI